MLVIREASARLGRWRLTGCTLCVTLEPGSTILVGRKHSEDGEALAEVDITIIPGEVRPEDVVTVPPEEPVESTE